MLSLYVNHLRGMFTCEEEGVLMSFQCRLNDTYCLASAIFTPKDANPEQRERKAN